MKKDSIVGAIIGAAVAIIIAVIPGLIWLGKLDAKIEQMDTEKITEQVIKKIQNTKTKILDATIEKKLAEIEEKLENIDKGEKSNLSRFGIEANITHQNNSKKVLLVAVHASGTNDVKKLIGRISPLSIQNPNDTSNKVAGISGTTRLSMSFLVPPGWFYRVDSKKHGSLNIYGFELDTR